MATDDTWRFKRNVTAGGQETAQYEAGRFNGETNMATGDERRYERH
jgi:hypothetical protein